MKVHSKFVDYYDSASFWMGETHWNREETSIVNIEEGLYHNWWYNPLKIRDFDKIFLVGFCGEVYTGVIRRETFDDSGKIEYVESKSIELDKWKSKFLELNIPIFVVEQVTWGRSRFYTNPILKDWGFYKIKDSFTAHQEIEMYLNNELAHQKDGSDLNETELQVLERHGMSGNSFKGKFTGRKYAKTKNS